MDRRIILSTLLLTILALAVFSYQPENEEPVEEFNYNVTLGYIATTESMLLFETSLVNQAEKDINNHCVEEGILWRFHFQIECAEGEAQKAFDITQQFADNDTQLVGGYGWSSFLCSGARKIAKDNNMTLVSKGSTSPLMAIPDNAFRLCVHDFRQVDPILAMFEDLGYESVLIIYRGDSWADGIVNDFINRYQGDVIETARYRGETRNDFTKYLDKIQEAYNNCSGESDPCVFLAGFAECADLMNQVATEYPELLNLTWIGTDGTADIDMLVNEAGYPCSRVKLYSPIQSPEKTDEWYQEINTLFREEHNRDMTYSEANTYDCCWLMAYCIIDTNTTDGGTILESIIKVSLSHRGITGDLTLDENGDRANYGYDFYRYSEKDGFFVSELCGKYVPETNKIEWIIDTT